LQIQGLGQLIQYLMRQPCAGAYLVDTFEKTLLYLLSKYGFFWRESLSMKGMQQFVYRAGKKN
jgi:hypothetical protein